MAELYKLTFANGKSYIGMTSRTAKWRYKTHEHLAIKQEFPYPVSRAWRKHGAPTMEVLAQGTREEILLAEKEAIDLENTYVPNGYNVIPGGIPSPMNVPEVRARAHIAQLAYWADPANRKSLSEKMANLEYKPYRSAEANAKRSATLKGRKKSPQMVERLKAAHAKNPQRHSEETKQKLREKALARSTARKAGIAT